MSKRKPTTEEFLASPQINAWCRDADIESYLKKSLRKGELLLINLHNVKRQENVFFKPKHRKTGSFRVYMDQLEETARRYGYTSIRVEGIVNEFLPEVLTRRGYTLDDRNGTLVFTEATLVLTEIEHARPSRNSRTHLSIRSQVGRPSRVDVLEPRIAGG